MSDKREFDTEAYEEPTVVKTMEETDKKCPACSGTMNFDPSSGKMVCPYCGNILEINPDGVPEPAEELSFYEAEATGNCNWGVENKTVVCENCGAETVYDALETAGECPYCGSNQVMEAAATNTLAPGGVCPFQVDQRLAEENFKRWLKKRWFCPLKLKKHAAEITMNGIYLPYWTFDTMTDTVYSARYGKTRTVTVGSGKNRRTETRVDWYPTSGAYNEFINDCLVKGSTRHNAKLLTSIEPYYTENNVTYRPEYLSGFAAERYSVGLDSAWGTAKGYIHRHLEVMITQEIKRRHYADRVANLRLNTVHHNITYKYLMLPVWISHYRYKNKTYNVMINGQTGKVGGKTPVSFWQVLLASLGALAIAVGIILLMMYGQAAALESATVEPMQYLPLP